MISRYWHRIHGSGLDGIKRGLKERDDIMEAKKQLDEKYGKILPTDPKYLSFFSEKDIDKYLKSLDLSNNDEFNANSSSSSYNNPTLKMEYKDNKNGENDGDSGGGE